MLTRELTEHIHDTIQYKSQSKRILNDQHLYFLLGRAGI